MTNNTTEKATLGHVATTMSYPVLEYIMRSSTPSRSESIMVFLFINYLASREQLLRLCGYKKEQSANLTVTLKRIEEKKFIEKIVVDNEGERVTLFYLSKKGVSEIKRFYLEKFKCAIIEHPRVKELFHAVRGDYEIEPAECVEYLSEQYLKFNFYKKQFSHFIGERELPLAFLSNVGYSSPYLFSCFHEVVFDSYGEPVSVYERLYKGMMFHKGEVRSDTAICFYAGGNDRNTINLYIEHDTGSQRTAVLREKIVQYMTYVFQPLLKKTPSLIPFLVFSISDKVSEDGGIKLPRMDFRTRERYLARGISFAASVYLGMHEEMYGVTLYELRDFVSSIPLSKKDHEDFLPFLDACINEVGGDKNAIDIVDKLYESSKHLEGDKIAAYRQKYERYYYNRRELLYGSIESVPGIKELFLEGVSICSVSNRQSATVRTFLPECCGMSAVISRTFSTAASQVQIKSLRALSRFPLEGKEITLRNVYILSDGRTIAVENIGDDYGAYHRVKYLLETDQAPCEILCIFSNLDTERVKNLFRSYRENKCMEHFYVMNYMVKEEEYTGGRDWVYTYHSLAVPGAIKALSLL